MKVGRGYLGKMGSDMVTVKISGASSFAPGEVDEGGGIDEERETERRSVDVSFEGAAQQQLVDEDVGDGRCLGLQKCFRSRESSSNWSTVRRRAKESGKRFVVLLLNCTGGTDQQALAERKSLTKRVEDVVGEW